MNEHERRYRGSIGGSKSAQARERYRKANNGQARRAPTPQAHQTKKQMTYDDYLAQVQDGDKIIEVNEDSKVERFLDFAETYIGWIRTKRDKYAPIAKQKLKTGAKRAVTKQPLTKDRLKVGVKKADGLLDPLKAHFGAQNVYFGMLTGTAVLVLLGGFLMFRGGGEVEVVQDGDLAVSETGFGEVQGAEITQPDFEVLTPADTSQQTQIFFDPRQGVASFQDKFKQHTFTISQQPLTDEQKTDSDAELEKIAVNLLAEVSFDTQFGTTYVTNTAPDGTSSQVAFFMTDDLLIFIRTSGTSLSADLWVEYINTIAS